MASLGTAVAVAVVCAVGLSSLQNSSAVAREAVGQQLAIIDDASAMSALQYQKGFVAEYLLTGNRQWLVELDSSRPQFESWLSTAQAKVSSRELRRLLDEIHRQYAGYDNARGKAVTLHDAGKLTEAKAVLEATHPRTQRLWQLFRDFERIARQDAEQTLDDAERNVKRLGQVLVGTSLAGALASLLAGFWWARRVTKPIYELQVQIESAAERTRIAVAPGKDGLEGLGEQVGALVEKLEEADTALAEHQRRLIQSEKLSAVGELAAKLAHEVLNPLAGMKAAVQLLVRQRTRPPGEITVGETAEALNREITRVEGLVRRLVNYSRPLAPRKETVTIESLLDSALEATQTILMRRGMTVSRHDQPGLPLVEVDPLLFTQALVNLLTNAAEAAGTGGRIDLTVHRSALRRDEVVIRVADNGPGLRDADMRQLFTPFFTTKPEGHGLGLAISHNIVVEHRGSLVASNRLAAEGPGAAFEIRIPVLP